MSKNIRTIGSRHYAEIIGGHGRTLSCWLDLLYVAKTDWPEVPEANIELKVITKSQQFRGRSIATFAVSTNRREGYSNINLEIETA